MKKKLLSVLLITMLIATSLTACGSGNKSDEQAIAENYSIACNTWGAGAYPLDSISHANEVMADIAGVTANVADNQFVADKIITDLQTQLAKGMDGVDFFSVVTTTFEPAKKICDEKQVPYILNSCFPADQDLFEEIKNDEYFVGGVTCNYYEMGAKVAKQALADGNKTATILTAAIGDYACDQREFGFTDTFEAGGGKVVQVMHCADPTEGTPKGKNLYTANPDVDCCYATTGDFMGAMLAIKKADNGTLKLYGSDIAPDLINAVTDGDIQMLIGGNHITGAIGMALLVNYLDGHQILDSNGKAPVLDYLEPYIITSENSKAFGKMYEEGNIFITDDQWKTLLYRFNEDVSFETFDTFAKEYANMVYDWAKDYE